MVSTKITFEKDGVQPPVFVAGRFTEWNPVEMAYDTAESGGVIRNVFTHQVELDPGDYQYKFRLGHGDWWLLDESAPTVSDEQGNVNNVLAVTESVAGASTDPAIPTPPIRLPSTKDIHDVSNGPSKDAVTQPAGVASNTMDEQRLTQPSIESDDPTPAHERQTGKITGNVASRKDSIPDFAPPPYSVAADGTVPQSNEKVQVAPVNEAPPQSDPKAIKPERSREQKSLLAQIGGGRGLVTVLALVAIPVGISYYLRR